LAHDQNSRDQDCRQSEYGRLKQPTQPREGIIVSPDATVEIREDIVEDGGNLIYQAVKIGLAHRIGARCRTHQAVIIARLQQRPGESVKSKNEDASQSQQLELKELQRTRLNQNHVTGDVVQIAGLAQDADQTSDDQYGGGGKERDRVGGMTGQDRVCHSIVTRKHLAHPTPPHASHASIQHVRASAVIGISGIDQYANGEQSQCDEIGWRRKGDHGSPFLDSGGKTPFEEIINWRAKPFEPDGELSIGSPANDLGIDIDPHLRVVFFAQ